MLSYPYESMEPFLQLIKEASVDPTVLTIKITIYRLAQKTRLVQYLCAAAENGKEVTVLIELRARFDEQNNIDWSERLEEAGCHVIYGFEGYKVHSKVCQITYRVRNEIQYITQIGTGNYNEKTAASYTDVSLLTANKEIGEDASLFFKKMSIGNLEGQYKHLIVSPTSLKKSVLGMIDEEIAKGENGRIIMKMNSVTDLDFIEKIKEASLAGVKIDLIVRGICCILPGIEGVTENLSVTSIVGRFLEHARIFSFGTGKEQKLYIGSADMMTRNTEKRVEVACPIFDETIKARLNHMLDIMLLDNTKARKMQSDGSYVMKDQSGERIVAQEIFMKEAMWEEVQEAKGKRTLWKRIFQSLAMK
jgi:polyphosphate kinase